MARTEAWAEFQKTRKEVLQLMQSAERAPDALEIGQRLSAQENHSRMVVVALIGYFQAYLSDLLEELADQLAEDWDSLSHIQKRYVAAQMRRRLESLLYSSPETGFNEERKVEQFVSDVRDCSDWHRRPSLLTTSVHRQDL